MLVLLTHNEASFLAMLMEGLRMPQPITNEDLEICFGLTPRQIVALMDFYRLATGRSPHTIATDTQPEGIADPDFKSPGVPPGYETIVGYLTEFEPRIWELIDYTAEATTRDGWWLKHRAKHRGLPVVKVQACPWLIRQGIFEVNAYPLGLLRERFSQ